VDPREYAERTGWQYGAPTEWHPDDAQEPPPEPELPDRPRERAMALAHRFALGAVGGTLDYLLVALVRHKSAGHATVQAIVAAALVVGVTFVVDCWRRLRRWRP
jgi:hypothetical protein